MNLFFIWILYLYRECKDAVEYKRQLSLSIKWQYDCLERLSSRWRIMDLHWHSIFDNSMHQRWLHFCYQFDTSVVKSLTLSIPYASCHLVFIYHFKVYIYSVLSADLWISRYIAFLTIPCVSHDSIFAINLMRRSWSHWRCRFHTPAVTQYSLTISSFTRSLFSLMIYGSTMT